MDKRCCEVYGLTEDILMEHAAEGIENYIRYHLHNAHSILIVAGPGNNGADGIALARLMQFGLTSVKLYMPLGVHSPMAKKQLSRVKKLDYIEIVESVCEADIIIDALFGVGLSRPLEEEIQAIVDSMNDLNGFKIACDIPTGIDEEGHISTLAFNADVTITMGAKKEALYADAAKDIVGEVIRVDLGLRYNYYTRDIPVDSYLLDKEDLTLPSRDFSLVTHKGSFGHAVVFCGEKEGAGIIAGMAASRFGAGLTSLLSHEKIYPPPYLMHTREVPSKATALAIGMGMGNNLDNTFLKKNIVDSYIPIILDADGLSHEVLLEILLQKEREVVLTPHPKEFVSLWKFLTGEDVSIETIQKNRFSYVRQFTLLYPHITLLLKGANVLIVQEGKIYINSFGSAKLSKGGSGDVLSGLIVALLAQGYSAIDAAIHGSLALTKAAEYYDNASYSMLPTDLIDKIEKLE